MIAYVEVKLDGQDISGNDILVENKIVLVPMIDTENDTTPNFILVRERSTNTT